VTAEGPIPALLTPFAEYGEVDLDLIDEHVAWLADRGVHVLSPMGTTGEGPSLSLAERKRIVARLATHPARPTLVAGTGCTALPETIELSRFAVERGAALLVPPPSYYPASPAGTTRWYLRLLDALPAEASLFLYHIPGHTGVPIEDEMLRALLDAHGPKVAGAKDSGGDIEHAVAWMSAFPELTILPGSDANAAAAYRAGAPGMITMLANVFPDELQAIRAGDDVERRQSLLTAVRSLLDEFPRHAALKHLLHLVSGLPGTRVRPPLEELTDEQRATLETRFHELRREVHV
jgi:4-hydroxy-tetrahydrodipicolinate synthase